MVGVTDSLASPTKSDSPSAPQATGAPSGPVPGFTAPGANDLGGANRPVRIGVLGGGDEQYRVLAAAATAEGIYLEIADYGDYSPLNPALASGKLDLNYFQHIMYLADFNVSQKQDLVPIGSTIMYPLGLYSPKYKTPTDIPAGATIAIVDDGVSLARGLQLLQSVGLIRLKPGTSALFGQVSDIDEAQSKVKIIAIQVDQVAQIAQSLTTPVVGVVISSGYLPHIGLKLGEAIAKDDATSDAAAPFINVWVARAADKDLPLYAEIVRLAHSDAWNQALLAKSEGTGVLVNDPPARLQAVLADCENQLKNR